MGEWKKTTCVLCAQNCGIEVLVEDNHIMRARGDKENPRSQGYICNKGRNIAYHEHNNQRLTHPLKRVNGKFERISWDQAIEEITERLRGIVDEYGPRSVAYMGGGGQGCHFEAAFGMRFLRSLGSRNYYSALGQELTGHFWAHGRATGKQYLFTIPDHEQTDLLLAVGWNGMVSHQMPRAPIVLKEISRDPERLLIVIDPRRSETAEIANIHLPIRPGTDALLTKAMIAIILQEGWQDQEYIDKHVTGFDHIVNWFNKFDARRAVEFCELDYETVREVCYLFATRCSSLHADLGTFMNRHSTLTSYLQIILLGICGRLCVPGGNIIPGHLMPLGAHSDERNEKTWRTVATDYPLIMGGFPPNVMPEEILCNKPERLRAVLVTQSNPLRSYADTTLYEEAFKKLDLLVTMELNMTETARLSDYVLPSRSGYECWDSTFFAWTFPGIYFNMRRPVIEPEGEPLEISEIFVRMADRMGFIPYIPAELYNTAAKGRREFAAALVQFLKEKPQSASMLQFIVAKTLGKELGSVNLSALWGLLQAAPRSFRESAVRVGFKEGPFMGDEIFQAIIDNPQGIWVGKADPNNMSMLRTEDGNINIYIPEVESWVQEITVDREAQELDFDEQYPLILMAGRHTPNNANTLMRNPEWLKDEKACTLLMHPADAEELNLQPGQMVRIVTEAGQAEIELEISDKAHKGQVVIPHGFGLEYEGKVYGVNVNRLTKNTYRDRIAGTPLHRHVPCRVETI